MEHTKQWIAVGALTVLAAAAAVPRLIGSGEVSQGDLPGGPVAGYEAGDVVFHAGFGARASIENAGAAAMPEERPSGLLGSIEAALERLERGLGRPVESAPLPAALPVERASTAARTGAGGTRNARERLEDFFSRHPLRGVLLSSSGDTLLFEGGSVRVGHELAGTGWTLAEVDGAGGLFVNGASRQRVDLPMGRGPSAAFPSGRGATWQGAQ